MPSDREVAGIRCSGVLAALPAYLDGELNPALRSRVDAHLAGCDWCERFGGSYAGVVSALRQQAGDGAVPEGVASRLRLRLADPES